MVSVDVKLLPECINAAPAVDLCLIYHYGEYMMILKIWGAGVLAHCRGVEGCAVEARLDLLMLAHHFGHSRSLSPDDSHDSESKPCPVHLISSPRLVLVYRNFKQFNGVAFVS